MVERRASRLEACVEADDGLALMWDRGITIPAEKSWRAPLLATLAIALLAGCQPAPPPPPPPSAPAAMVAAPPPPASIAQAHQYVALVRISDVVDLFQDELAAYVAAPAGNGNLALVPVAARITVVNAVGQNASGELGAGIEVLGYGVHVGAGQKYALISEQELEVQFEMPAVQSSAASRAPVTHLNIAGAAKALLAELVRASTGHAAPLVPSCAKLTFNFELEANASESGGVEAGVHGSLVHEESNRRADRIEIDFRVQGRSARATTLDACKS